MFAICNTEPIATRATNKGTVMPPEMSDSDVVQSITRIVLRPLGSALPLGFFAFGVGVMLLSALELHWIGGKDAQNIPFILLGFVAPLELLAAVIAFLSRDTSAATALGIFALSWVPQSLVILRQGSTASPTLGVFLCMIAIMMAVLGAVAYSSKPLLSVILEIAFVRTGLAAAVQLGMASVGGTAAIIGLILTVFSLYGGTAFLVEDAKNSDVLPLFRRGTAQRAMSGDLREQLLEMPNKPGVRRQL